MRWGSPLKTKTKVAVLIMGAAVVLSSCSGNKVVRQDIATQAVEAVPGCPKGTPGSVATCEAALSAFSRAWKTFDQVWASVPVRSTKTLEAACEHVPAGTPAPEECQGDLPLLARLATVASNEVVYGYWGAALIGPAELDGDRTEGAIRPVDPIVVTETDSPALSWPSPAGTLRLAPPPGAGKVTTVVVKACFEDSLSVRHDGKPVPLEVNGRTELAPGAGDNPAVAFLQQRPNGQWTLADFVEGPELRSPSRSKGVSPCGAGW